MEHLGSLKDGSTVVVVEGERARDALAPKGIFAVGTVCGAGVTPSPEALKPLRRFRVVLWADADTAGVSHMQGIEANLRDMGLTPLWVSWPDALPKADAADAVHSGEDVLALIEYARASADREETLSHEPSHEQRWPAPMAPEAFHGLAGEIVRKIAPHSEADQVALLLNFLTAFGNCIGRGQHAVAEADHHGTNLNVVLVGESAKGRKGTSWGRIRDLLARVDPIWAEQHIANGLSSGEGLIWEVRNPIEKSSPVKKDGKPTGEFTTEVTDQGVEDKRLLVFESEFASPLKRMAGENNTLSVILRQAWDSGNLRAMTKNSPARSTDAHISVIGNITREELLRYLSETESGNGFANRFLWACTRRGNILPEGGGQVDYRDIVPRLHQAIQRASTSKVLERDQAAREAWADAYPELSEGRPGLLGAVTARGEAQVLRLSVLYAALDGDDFIKLPHLEAAMAIWEYSMDSARYIFGDATGDVVADRILNSLRANAAGQSRTQISNLFARNIPIARIDAALTSLKRAGKAKSQLKESQSQGRPSEIWHAT